MRDELDEKLCKAFPILYSGRNLPMTETAMCWGFECRSGWFDLIWDLSDKLEEINKKLPDGPKVVAFQVKEKFGTLHFYTGGIPEEVDDEVYNLICKAEDISEKTCEVCGDIGELRGKGWLFTACDTCDEKRK